MLQPCLELKPTCWLAAASSETFCMKRILSFLLPAAVLALVVLLTVPFFKSEDKNIPMTYAQVNDLVAEIDAFYDDEGNYPTKPEEIAKIDGLEANDGWGTALYYTATKDEYLLYSFGPNLMDDEGESDDVVPKALQALIKAESSDTEKAMDDDQSPEMQESSDAAKSSDMEETADMSDAAEEPTSSEKPRNGQIPVTMPIR